jgi:hypothetical protein
MWWKRRRKRRRIRRIRRKQEVCAVFQSNGSIERIKVARIYKQRQELSI